MQRLAVHQDYAWFAGLVLWCWSLAVWWRHPRRREDWGWLPAAMGAAVAAAGVQFLIYDPTFDWFQDRLVPGTVDRYEPAVISVELLGDFLLGLIWAVLAAAWWWSGQTRTGRTGRRWLGLPGAALAGAGYYAWPEWGTWALVAAVGTGAWAWRSVDDAASRRALALAAGMSLVSTVGPLAALTVGLQREAAATPWGLIAAGGAILAAGGGLAGLWRAAMAARPGEDAAINRRELRWFAVLAAVWMVLGIGYAHRVGVDNRRELHRNRLRTVAAEAMVFDPARLEAVVGRELALEWRATQAGMVEPIAPRLPALGTPAAQALRRELARIRIETPFLDRARIVVMDDGWMMELVSNRVAREGDEVDLLRRATAEDLARWEDPEPYVEPGRVGEIGERYFCRAPIVASDGRMLGWLDYVRREFFQSLERKWRAGPLLVVALGLAAGGLVVLQRRSLRERELAWRTAALENEASRLKTAFLAKVSHELRTPLQSLLGYSELLERDAADATARRRLGRLREHGDLLLRLVNDLLDLSAIEADGLRLQPQPVELDRVVAGVVDDLQPRAAAKGLTLQCEVAEEVEGRWFEADAARVRQIVFNLVGNALKFTDAGAVVVRLGRVAAATEGDPAGPTRLALEVSDTGPGIAPAEQSRLFEAFARLDKTAAHEGTGLGLAMVAALARLMDGGVRVESDGASGTTFTVELALTPAAPPAYTRAGQPPAPTSLAGCRIVVAEDNPLVAELFVAVLTDLGAHCTRAADGEAACRAVLAGGVDVLVLDLALPQLDGVAVARRLRAPGVGARALRIVGVSAHAAAEDRAQALAAGMDAFLSKPVELADLVAAIAGAGSATGARLPGNGIGAAIKSRLEAQFRADAARQREAVAAALRAEDGERLRRRTHYLANSASAVGDTSLLAACRALETYATASGPQREAAWVAVETALQPWLGDGRDGA